MSAPTIDGDGIIHAVRGRRSIRRFLPTAVPNATIRAILDGAARAPSGTNIQPWFVHVVIGAARDRLVEMATKAGEADKFELEYHYLPEQMEEPYLSRRRKVGYSLYEIYGIDRTDYAARKAAMLRNYSFFGAPVGLFFTMERHMAMGAWLDCGMFMQNVMILARAHSLETCPQQAWCDIGPTVHHALNIPSGHIILSGMALGYADWTANENTLLTDRVPADEFTNWHQ